MMFLFLYCFCLVHQSESNRFVLSVFSKTIKIYLSICFVMFLRTIKIQQVTMERMALGIEFMIPFSNDDFYVYARRQASAESFAAIWYVSQGNRTSEKSVMPFVFFKTVHRDWDVALLCFCSTCFVNLIGVAVLRIRKGFILPCAGSTSYCIGDRSGCRLWHLQSHIWL